MDFLLKQVLSPPTLSIIVGGLVVAIFGYKASRSKDQKTPRGIAFGTLIGGILVLIGGIWSGINESKNIELLQSRADQIFTLSSQNANLSNKIAALSEQNFDLGKELLAFTTGGDSYCYISPMFDEMSQWLTMMLHHKGKYPLYDVVLQVQDITGNTRLPFKELYDEITESHKEDDKVGRNRQRDLHGELMKLLSQNRKVITIGTFLPNTGLEVLRIPWPTGDIQEYLINVFSRSAHFTQIIKAKKIRGRWVFSYRVFKKGQGKSMMLTEVLNPEVELPKN
jgi:hypothetical protein